MSQEFNITEILLPLKTYVNDVCHGKEPWEIIAFTLATVCLILILNKFISYLFAEGVSQRILRRLRTLPIIKQAVEKKMQDTVDEIEGMLQKGLEDKQFLQTIPKISWKFDDILQKIKTYKSFGEFEYQKGYVSGAVYVGNDEVLEDLMEKVFGLTAYTNPLHPDVFPGIRVMEAEVVHMVADIFNAPKAVGTLSTGGTESIFLACKAYRDYAKDIKGINEPNMVIPVTAHAAFDKAAQALKIRVKHVAIDSETMKVKVKNMKKAIDKNTCMIVGSAPAFPHGCIDDIEEISKLGYKYSIPVHVDCCLGGFLVPFLKLAGFPRAPFDFTLPGVTSISADTHKYAYAPKGTSVILYRDKKYRHYQYTVQSDWPGGIYGTPTLLGSRSGGLIATCWASLLYHGEDKYVECTRKIVSVTRYIVKSLREIEGIFIYGKPDVSVIAIGSKCFDVYRLSSALAKKGWNLNQIQYPPGFHICITMQHTYEGVADKLLSDTRECTKKILNAPKEKTTGSAAVYGMAAQIPDRSLVSELVWAYLDACYTIKSKGENGPSK